MRGQVPLERIYAERLALVRPTRAELDAIGRRYVEALVPDAREVVAALKAEGVAVRVISGGLLPAVRALAGALEISEGDVGAVAVYFDAAGEYAGFDEGSPLSRSGGKREVLERWRREVPHPIMLVGDGATDLEARPAVDCFVAFAGVVERPAVAAQADVVVRARSLAPILPLALALEPPSAGTPARATFEKGVRLLEGRDATHEARAPGS
jgi:phosphoserine phosphatase